VKTQSNDSINLFVQLIDSPDHFLEDSMRSATDSDKVCKNGVL